MAAEFSQEFAHPVHLSNLGSQPHLDLVANARLPSRRAQSLQVVHVAGAFQSQGARVRLLHARRHPTPSLAPGQSLFEHYGLRLAKEPVVQAVPCWDFIERVPTRLQYLPARLQEWSFARNAARLVLEQNQNRGPGLVLTRELECARHLVRAGAPNVFLELHRLPGGRLRQAWLREALAGVCGVIAISGGVAADLLELGLKPERMVVEHDGADLRAFVDAPQRSEARALLGLEAQGQVVAYTGSFLPWKGVPVLIDAARDLPDVQFVIAGGSAAEVENMARRAANLGNLRFDGYQSPDRVRLYLRAADILCVPNRSTPAISARYTSPLKIFEAMAAGVPMVVSDLPSMRDILEQDSEAEFVAPDDAQALAQGIRRLLDDGPRRARMAERLAKRAPLHSWERRAERLLRWMGARCPVPLTP